MFTKLQALRASAAIGVMLFHLGASTASPQYFSFPYLNYITRFGYAGMFLFFVLSGFIIHHVHSSDFGRPDRAKSYILKRALRIYPIYIILFSLISFFSIATGIGSDGIPDDAIPILNALLLLPQNPHVVGGTGARVIIVAWSLQYEMLFYACMLLFILHIRIASLALVTLVFAYIIFPLTGLPNMFPAYLEWKFLICFAFGIVTSIIFRSGVSSNYAIVLSRGTTAMFALFGIVAAIVMFRTDGAISLVEMSAVQVALSLGAAVLILGKAELERQNGRPAGKAIRLLGDWSYAIYLLHFPVISAISKVTLALGFKGLAGVCLVVAGSVAATMVGSAFLHYTVEKPAITFARRAARSPHPR